MSGYRPGHDPGGHDPYIDYAAQAEQHPEERGYASSHHPELQQHVGAPGLTGALHIDTHHPHQQHQQVLLDPHGMAHHQSPQSYGGGQQMMYRPPLQQPGSGRKRTHEGIELEMGGLAEGHMGGEMQSMTPQMPQPGMGYGGAPQAYHSHGLPEMGRRDSKVPRLGEAGDTSIMSQSAPSVVGTAGMPQPAARPRGPKLKFTPEDDQLLVDLKENKALTWKQIAEFFPGRSSGTLQVRYCTKLKAKTTQWTDDTVGQLYHV